MNFIDFFAIAESADGSINKPKMKLIGLCGLRKYERTSA